MSTGPDSQAVAASDDNGGNPDPLLDAAGAARYLGLVGVVKHPEQAVRALCRKLRLTHAKVCGKIMVRRSELDRYIAEHTTDAVQADLARGRLQHASHDRPPVGHCNADVARFFLPGPVSVVCFG